jgi:hypothetical protein
MTFSDSPFQNRLDLTSATRLSTATAAPGLTDSGLASTATDLSNRSASALPLGTAINNGTIAGRRVISNDVGSRDLWDIQQFQVANSGSITLELSGLRADADVYLVRDYNGNGQWDGNTNELIAYSVNPGTNAESVTVTGLAAGTYYAVVATFDGVTTNYSLAITTDVAGSTYATAGNFGTLTGTVSVSDFVGTSDPVDVYAFRTTTASNFQLSLTGLTADADVYLVRDNNLNGIYDNGDDIASSVLAGSNSESISYSGLAAGNYFVRVEQFSGNTNYTLSLTATSSDIGNSYATSFDVGTLSGQRVFNGSVSPTDLGDVYRFSTGTTSDLRLDLTGLSSDADLYLVQDVNLNGVYDSADLLAFSARTGTGAEQITVNNLAAGSYFAWVTQFSGTTNYTLTMTTDAAGNTLSDARDIGILNSSRSYRDFVGNSDTRDVYRFQVGTPTTVNVSLSGLTADADVRVIRDVNGNGLVDSGDVVALSVNAGTASESLTANLSTGTYFVQVNQFVSSSATAQTPTDTNYVLRLTPVV